MKKYLLQITSGISAGLLITIGSAVFLAVESKVVGAIFFSVALISICYLELSLYTGKIGFIVYEHKKEDFSVLLLGLLGNFIGTLIFGLAIKVAIPSLREVAYIMCTNKLSQEFWQTLIRGMFCGVLMYVAVFVFKKYKTPVGIIFCIPTFILAGFEHSIADMAYFAISGIVSFKAFVFILMVILGNTFGAMIIPVLTKKE